MKNWENLEADENHILSVHFSPGRSGQKVQFIVLHHNGGNLSLQGCYDTWQTREASAHYQVDSNGRIGQYVWDRDTAWHAGDWNANIQSIGIEHADSSSNPWRISDACLENGAHLVAAICHYFGLGRPAWMQNVFPHSHFIATACPASIAGDQNAQYMSRAQAWYDAMANGSAPAAPAPSAPSAPSVDLNQMATDVINGKYGNGQDRVNALGGYYNAVMEIVNQRLLGGNGGGNRKSDSQVADEVINGQWGNDPERRSRLASAGYNPDSIQALVNQKLGQGGSGSNIDEVARAVIRGDYGNDPGRSNLLRSQGYDPVAVQRRVNQLLS